MNITNLHPQYLKGLVDGIGFTLKFQNKVKPIIFNASVAFFRLMNKFGISFLFLICITLPGFSIQRQECYLFEKANHICELKEKQQHIENLKMKSQVMKENLIMLKEVLGVNTLIGVWI